MGARRERAKSFVPTDEQIRQRIAEREQQAGEHGHVPKTQKQIKYEEVFYIKCE